MNRLIFISMVLFFVSAMAAHAGGNITGAGYHDDEDRGGIENAVYYGDEADTRRRQKKLTKKMLKGFQPVGTFVYKDKWPVEKEELERANAKYGKTAEQNEHKWAQAGVPGKFNAKILEIMKDAVEVHEVKSKYTDSIAAVATGEHAVGIRWHNSAVRHFMGSVKTLDKFRAADIKFYPANNNKEMAELYMRVMDDYRMQLKNEQSCLKAIEKKNRKSFSKNCAPESGWKSITEIMKKQAIKPGRRHQ